MNLVGGVAGKLDRIAHAHPDLSLIVDHMATTIEENDALEFAANTWQTINEVNLVENIRPTRGRATLVLFKGDDHRVSRVRLRKT